MTTTCRPPDRHIFRFDLGNNAANFGSPLELITDGAQVAALEIGPRSEVDALLVTTGDNQRVPVVVGAPAVGPFVGPFRVDPLGGINPLDDDGESWVSTELRTRPPVCELVRHFQCPPVFMTKRSPARRVFAAKTLTGSYQTLGEVPIYGRRVTTLHLEVTGAGTVTFRIRGRRYRPQQSGARDPIDWAVQVDPETPVFTSEAVDLVLDGSSNTTATATADTSFTVEDEAFETLEVQALTSSANDVRLSSEAWD